MEIVLGIGGGRELESVFVMVFNEAEVSVELSRPLVRLWRSLLRI
jgi:hypothetical protein